jgi:hypothetical protein
VKVSGENHRLLLRTECIWEKMSRLKVDLEVANNRNLPPADHFAASRTSLFV